MADYKVGVELALVGGISAALAAVAAQMVRLNTLQSQINQGFGKWRGLLIGIGEIFAAGAIVKGLNDIAKAGDKVVDALRRMELQGQKAGEIAAQYKEAVRVSGLTGRSLPEVLAEGKAATYYTGSSAEAVALQEKLAKMETVYHAASGKSMAGQITPILKILEEAGILGNPTREGDLNKILEGVTRDITATGGTVTPQQILLNFLYARSARYGWTTPEALSEQHPFLTSVLPYMIQSFGGAGVGSHGGQSGPGAAFMSEYTKNVQGIISKKSMMEAEKLGILEGHQQIRGSMYDIGHFKNPELYQKNPYEWIQQVLMPALKEKGITSTEQIIQELSKLYGTRMAADPAIFMALFGRGRLGALSPIERHMRMQDQAKGIDEGFQVTQSMPQVVMERMKNEWARFWEIIGTAMNPTRVAIMKGLADLFEHMGDAAAKIDPAQIQAVGNALLGLAAGLAAMGTLTAIGALSTALSGPMGLIAVFIGLAAASETARNAIGLLITALLSADNEKARAAGQKVINSFVKGLDDGVNHLFDVGKFAIQRLGEGIMAALSDLKGQIQDMLSHLNPWGPNTHHPTPPLPGEPPPPASHPHANRLAPPGWTPQAFGYTPNPAMLIPASLPAPSNGGVLRGVNFAPGGGGRSVNVHNVINLDGQTVAQAINSYNIADGEHPQQAPYHDGMANFTPPDSQLFTG